MREDQLHWRTIRDFCTDLYSTNIKQHFIKCSISWKQNADLIDIGQYIVIVNEWMNEWNGWMNGMKSNEMNGGSTCQCREPRRLTYRHVMLLLDGANLVRYLVTNCINVYTKFLDSWSCHSMIIVIMDRLLFSVKTVITIYWSNDVASMRNVSNSYTRSIQKNTMKI